jgi:hypothetical protein
MMRRTSMFHAALAAASLLTLVACQAKKSSNPLSPSVAGPIAGVGMSPPVLLEPQQGFKFKENQQPIKLVIENAATNSIRPMTYTFEVASDADFNNKVFARSGVAQGEGRTSVQLDSLELGRAYYWRAKADDGANSSTFATASFEVLPRAVLTVPAPLSPGNNERVGELRPTLKIAHSEKNAAVEAVMYFYVVAKDQAFTQIVASALWEDNQWPVNRELDYGASYFWRVRATDGDVTTGWSPTQAFRAPAAPAPSPSPSPSPGPTNPGGPCNFGDPNSIVQCERNKYGHMNSGQILSFLTATAQSLNRNGISGGPFGILRKTGGTNCGGYSCDIICAGQGSGQRQHDVLGDVEGLQAAGWGGTKTAPNIRIDVCEIK